MTAIGFWIQSYMVEPEKADVVTVPDGTVNAQDKNEDKKAEMNDENKTTSAQTENKTDVPQATIVEGSKQ